MHGWARAWSPILDNPLEGDLVLREGSGKYPDIAIDLDGAFRLPLTAHIRTRRGRIRAGFDRLPDVPVSKFVLFLDGGGRGMIVNSVGLCRHRPQFKIRVGAHNDVLRDLRPKTNVACLRKRGKRRGSGARGR